MAKKARKSKKITVKHHPSWDQRSYSKKKKGALSLTHSSLNTLSETSPERLIQGIRGLSVVLRDIALSPCIACEDDEKDILYTAERLEIYTAALLTVIPDKKKAAQKSFRKKRNNAKDLPG